MTGGLDFLGLSEIKLSIFWKNICDQTSSDGLSSFSQSESRSFGDSDWEVKLGTDREVISWLCDLDILRQANFSSSICSFIVQLWSVS